MKSPLEPLVEIKLTILVTPDKVDALSSELKAITEKYDLRDGKLEQSNVGFPILETD